MTEHKNETSLHVSIVEPEEEMKPTHTPELNACLKIVEKPHDARTPVEINHLVKRIIEMDIFDKYVLENLDPKSVLTKLVPFFKYQQIPAGSPIFHYEHTADKFYIILKGKAREFEPKDIETIEKESRSHYRSDPISKNAVLSLPELPENPTIGSMSALKNAPFQSLNSLEVLWEEDAEQKDQEEAKDKASNALKKFRKMKAVLPFLKKMMDQKTATQRITDYNYKKALRRQKSVQRTLSQEELPESQLDAFAEKLDESILEEFKRYPKSYFIGGVLKVKFLRYLFAGDYCGLRALTENSLRNRAVLADEDCHCLVLAREDYLKIIEKERELNADKIEFFRKMFDKFETRRVMKFSLLWNCQTLNKGDTVFTQGEASDHLFALSHGDVVLSTISSDHTNSKKTFIGQELPFRIKKKQEQQGSVIRVSTVCAGDIFGGENFFQGSNREFTATVSSVRAKIFRLPLESYQESQKQFWDMFKELKSIMSLKVKWNKERLEELSNKQSLTQSNFFPSRTLSPSNEKVKQEIAKFLHYTPKRPNNTLDLFEKPISHSDHIFESPSRTASKTKTAYVFEHQYNIDGKLGTKIKEKIRFGSPQNFPNTKTENLDKLNLVKSSVLAESNSSPQPPSKEKVPEKPPINLLENFSLVDDGSQLFSRGLLPKYYANKNEEVVKNNKEDKNPKMDIFGPKIRTPRRANTEHFKNNGATRSASIQVLKKKVLESRASDVFASKLQPVARRPSIELDMKPENLNPFKMTNTVLSPSFASLGHIKTEKSNKKFKLLLLSNTPQKKSSKLRVDRQSLNTLELSDKIETKRNVSLAQLDFVNKGPELILVNEPINFFSHGCPANSKIFSSSTRSKKNGSNNIIKSLNNLQPVTLGTERDANFEKENCKGFKTIVDDRSVMNKVQAVRILHS